jgi:hypothetical protein
VAPVTVLPPKANWEPSGDQAADRQYEFVMLSSPWKGPTRSMVTPARDDSGVDWDWRTRLTRCSAGPLSSSCTDCLLGDGKSW